jgi:hypothetical protein
MPAKKSRPWRLVLSTPGSPLYTEHRSRNAAYVAAGKEEARAKSGATQVFRIAVDQWNADGQRWNRYETVWSKTREASRTPLEEAHNEVKEELVLLAAPEADRVRELIEAAMQQRDAETVRSEGHQWSGRIGLKILELADRIEEA